MSVSPAGSSNARGEEPVGVRQPFQAAIQKEPIKRDPPAYRAYLTAGEVKLAFLIPDKCILTHKPDRSELDLNHREGGQISLVILSPLASDGGGLKMDACRDQVLEEFPNARITQENSPGGDSRRSPCFDLTWKTTNDVVLWTRTIFMSSPAGVLQFRATAIPRQFPEIQANLNTVLGTLSTSTNGQFKVTVLSDQI